MVNDKQALYEDANHTGLKAITGRINTDPLDLRTAQLLSGWVDKYEKLGERPVLEILGTHLYRIAFGGVEEQPPHSKPVGEAFEALHHFFELMTRDELRLRLRLVIHKDAVALSTLPWEFLYVPRGESGFFLAGERTELILTRFVPELHRITNLDTDDGTKALRILIVVSSPRELQIVDAEKVIDEIQKLPAEHNQFEIRQLQNPDRVELEEAIDKFKPQLMHFVGHGKEGALALRKPRELLKELDADYKRRLAFDEDAEEVTEADWVPSGTFKDVFARHKPRLVFLQACKGAAHDSLAESARSFGNTARELAYWGVPAVIAMQYEISNTYAQVFATTFYKKIREGKQIDEAVQAARQRLGFLCSWGDRSFATPVIYLHSEVPIIKGPPAAEEPSAAQRTNRAGDAQTQTMGGKVPCPYPQCLGAVIPGDKFCLKCQEALAECPQCNRVVAVKIGRCARCGYSSEPQPAMVGGAPAATAGAPSEEALSQPRATRTDASVTPVRAPSATITSVPGSFYR